MPPDPIATLLKVTRALDSLGVDYCVGGSLASSLYGIPRATNDVDLVAALRPEHAAPLVAELQDAFMIDGEVVRTAIANRRAFNIIDYHTLDKVDIFVVTEQPWSRQQILRRQLTRLSAGPDAPGVYFASPEDVILSKLVWFRRGGEVSDRQWNDILSVLATQGSTLDKAYLRHWAMRVGVTDLLERALLIP